MYSPVLWTRTPISASTATASGTRAADYNEMNDIWTAAAARHRRHQPARPLRWPTRKAGVTCVCTGPGSASVLGGTFLAMKTVGERVDNMIVRDPVAMKCAFGENPSAATVTSATPPACPRRRSCAVH